MATVKDGCVELQDWMGDTVHVFLGPYDEGRIYLSASSDEAMYLSDEQRRDLAMAIYPEAFPDLDE